MYRINEHNLKVKVKKATVEYYINLCKSQGLNKLQTKQYFIQQLHFVI